MGGRRRRYEFPEGGLYRFREEKNFEMYQDVSSNGFVKMTGTYTFDETSKKLTGKYSDGENWAYDYTVSGVDWLFGPAQSRNRGDERCRRNDGNDGCGRQHLQADIRLRHHSG